ncbi:MAG: dihydrolipoamide acetyltransferase family protein [Deltaproteobacteria bacterium]
MTEFKMPSLGADMEAGLLVAWQKQPGDAIHRGDLIAEVETDKGIIEIEAFVNGVLDKVLVPVGQKVPVGTVLALIRDDGAAAAAVAPPARAPGAKEKEAAPPAPAPPAPSPRPPQDLSRLPMSPSARRLARELGVDPTTVHGTGPGGAITREDIERAAAVARRGETADLAATPAAQAGAPVAAVPPAPPVQPPAPATPADRLARMRQTIAAAMSRSKREIPHYYLSTTIDMHPALEWMTGENLTRPVTERLLYGVLLLKAVALALREVPELNAVWEQDHPVLKPAINVGAAISLRQGGLIAPGIHDTDQKSLDQLMTEFRDLVNRARAGRLRSSELSDPTITVTSLGDQGVEAVFGVIYPPQVAIVGFGKVVERPWSINGGLLSRRVLTATLSADHRVSDGHRGGLFLAAVDRLLQEPQKL